MYYIGIDIGTSSLCGVIYNPETKSVASISKDNKANIRSSLAWESVQDPSLIMDTVMEILREFTDQYADIKGIGVTGQMHGILYVDEKGNALSPLYTWLDGRGNLPFNGHRTYVERLSDLSGYSLATGYGAVTHFYNLQNNLVPAKAVKICTIMDYVVMKLAGRSTPLTDYANGASFGFFDLKNLCFDTASLEKADIDSSMMPDTVEAGVLAGYFADKIPVYAATGDNQASFLGSVGDIAHSIHITVGTSSQLSVYSKDFVKVEQLDTRPFPGGGYILVGAALCGGLSLTVLKSFFANTLKLFGATTDDSIDLYEKMTVVAESAVSNDFPVVETTFNGTRLEPSKRGAIFNISTTNFTPENLITGFLKGIASELYAFYERIPDEIKKNKNTLVGSGNGLKKNPLLAKIIENRFNCKLILSERDEEAALGACFLHVDGDGCNYFA